MAELSIRGYAEHRREAGLTGATPWAVQKALKEGRIAKNAQGKIEPEDADAAWERNSDPIKRNHSASKAHGNGEGAAPGVPSLAQSRSIREAYAARLARLDYEERTGALVSAVQVRETAFTLARKLRDRMMAIPERTASELASLTDARAIRDLLEAQIREALEELSRG